MLKGLKTLFSNNEKSIVCTAVIVAAGSGRRMNSEVKKQFLTVFGRPVLAHTIEAVERCTLVRDIVIVVSEEDIMTVKDIVLSSDCKKVTEIVAGGEKRAQSVAKGLKCVRDDTDIILIHDGVRPVVAPLLIENVILDAMEYGAAALGVKPKDTVKAIDRNGFISTTLDRENLVFMQTPQCFKAELIKKAYENYDENATDDCVLVENLGIKVKVTEGSYANIKLTTPEDMAILHSLIEMEYEE